MTRPRPNLACAFALLLGSAAGAAGRTPVRKITRPDLKPQAVAVYEAGNKSFVADDTTGNLFIYDGTDDTELGSVPVGRKQALCCLASRPQDLAAGTDQNLGPVALFTVTSGTPRGSYRFGSRVVDPTTGELVGEDVSTFEISAAAASPATPRR